MITAHRDGIVGLAHDECFIYSGSRDRTAAIWSGADLSLVHRLTGFPCGVRIIGDPPWAFVITAHGTRNRQFSAWRLREGERPSKEHEFELRSRLDLQGMVQDESAVYVTARDGRIFVIDKREVALDHILESEGAGIWGVAVDETDLYTASVDGVISVWDKATRRRHRVLTGHRANIQAIVVDDTRLYSISTDKTARVWDKETGELVWEYRRLFDKGMLGIAVTGTHLIFLNLTRGLRAVRLGRWDGEMVARPDVRSTKLITCGDRCLFGLENGGILVASRQELGV